LVITIEDEQLNSISILSSLLEDADVGGARGRNTFARAHIIEKPVRRAYLLISATLNNPFNRLNKWKISLNGVAITREYNPHIETSFMGKIHSVFVYDVTKTIKDPEVELLIVYDGKDPIRIDNALLITIHEYPEIHTRVEGYIDLKPLTPNGIEFKYRTAEKFTPNEAKLYIGISALRSSTVNIVEGNSESVVNRRLNPGFTLIEIDEPKHDEESVKIFSDSYHVKHVYSVRFLTKAVYPSIDVEEMKVSEDSIAIKIRNRGPTAADKVMVIALRFGMPLARETIENFAALEAKDIELRISRNRPTHIRIVWMKGGRTFIKDIKLDKLP